MAHKTSPNSLIHCAECGEDYSATYKRCPFCGAKNAPFPASDPNSSREAEYESDQQSASGRREAPADLDDTYVFDGQDLFDDQDEDDSTSSRPKGGKRLAGKSLSNPFANADINWPRVITFICSLVIIVAAMVIVFTWIYPQLRGDKDPVADNSQSPSSDVSGGSTAEPGTSDPGADTTNPGVESSPEVSPSVSSGLKSFTTNISGPDAEGFTLRTGESWQMKLTFNPTSWSGEVTYSVSDTRYATVSAGGNVVNVNQDSSLHTVYLTITAGDVTIVMPVYCRGVTATATEPPATNPPASDPPATPAPSGPGTVPVGRQGTVVNAPGGVYVRATPNSSTAADNLLGSLFNGNPVTVLEAVGDDWYKITFAGVNGTTEGYLLSECVSLN